MYCPWWMKNPKNNPQTQEIRSVSEGMQMHLRY